MRINFIRASQADKDATRQIIADPAYRASYTGPKTLQAMRAGTVALAAHASIRKVQSGITLVENTLNGIPCETLTRPDADADRVILYLHGGAFVRGSLELGRANASLLAAAAGVRVVAIAYRQAPEHPYPAAPADLLKAYDALLDSGIGPDAIVVAGESSGGCLALGLAAALDERAGAFPAGIAGISPMVDLDQRGASWIFNADKDLADLETGRQAVGLYVSDTQRRDPVASPVRFHFRNCCPVLLSVGSHETMLSDSERLAHKADEAGVDVTFNVYEDMPHGFTRFDTTIGTGAILDAARWCAKRLFAGKIREAVVTAPQAGA